MDDLIDLRTLHQDRRKDPENVEIGPNDLSIDLLRAVYRSNHLPLTTRMRAAISALKHEVPALGVQFVVNDSDIATRLDRAIARIALVNGKKVINGEAAVSEPTPLAEPQPAPALPNPLTRIYSSSFRRRI
jgi:hypothetical protein